MARRRTSSRAITIRRPTVVVSRRRGYSRSRSSGGIPAAVIAGLVPPFMDAYNLGKARNYPGGPGFWEGFGHQLLLSYTGYSTDDKKFYFQWLLRGWGPLIAGLIAHRLADRFGINRRIRSFGSPIVI